MKTPKTSKWFIWGFVPFFNFVAWIHAAIRTRQNSHLSCAAIYAVPFTFALVLGMVEKVLGLSNESVERLNDIGGTAGALLWIAGIIHVLLKKNSVDQQIQAYEDSRMQGSRVVPDAPVLRADPSLANQRGSKHECGERVVSIPVGGTIENSSLSGTSNTDIPVQQSRKTFRYVDGQGSVFGPATLASLQALKQAGVVSDSTQVIDDESKRSVSLGQLLAMESDTARPQLQDRFPSANQVATISTLPCTPPPSPLTKN